MKDLATKITDYLTKNPKGKITVSDSQNAKVMVFSDSIQIVESNLVCVVIFKGEVFETDIGFFDAVLSLLQSSPLKN